MNKLIKTCFFVTIILNACALSVSASQTEYSSRGEEYILVSTLLDALIIPKSPRENCILIEWDKCLEGYFLEKDHDWSYDQIREICIESMSRLRRSDFKIHLHYEESVERIYFSLNTNIENGKTYVDVAAVFRFDNQKLVKVGGMMSTNPQPIKSPANSE